MNERLTIQDLTDLLAARHSMTKKDAEAFVKEFFLLIEQALESENTVKIKGLGTFKLIDVDSRESVNVNTGERFQIKGHTKVSFSPDASLKDIINKPFAHFETVVLNENTILEDTPVEETEEEETGEEIPVQTLANEKEEVQKDDYSSTVIETNEAVDESENLSEEEVVQEEQVTEQSEETTIEEQITDEIAPLVVEEPIEQPKEEEVVKETSIIEQQPTPIKEKERFTAEEIIEKELLKANLKPEISIIPAKEENVTPVKPAQATASPNSKKKNPAKEKSPVPYLIAVIILVLLLCGGVVLFIYYPDLFSSSSDKNALDMPPVTTQPVQPEAQLSDTIEHKDTIKEITPDMPKAVVTPQPVAKKEEVSTPAKTENKVVQQPSASAYLDSASYKITGTKTKYTIKEGETLTRVSLQFYGTKAMWPYIVKHNPDVIKNPNNVPYGTTIKIPELIKE